MALPPSAEDRLVRDLLMGAGTRVWIADDVEEFREDQLFLRRLRTEWSSPESVMDREYVRSRGTSYREWRVKWGKIKLATLIAFVGAVITLGLPHLIQSLLALRP